MRKKGHKYGCIDLVLRSHKQWVIIEFLSYLRVLTRGNYCGFE